MDELPLVIFCDCGNDKFWLENTGKVICPECSGWIVPLSWREEPVEEGCVESGDDPVFH